MDAFDFIVIGAGSAGCVLAERLSAGGRHRVLVLEAGGSDRSFWVQMPIGYGKLFYDARRNWRFTAQADAGLNGRASYWPRGKIVGGSSSINAMVYCRGLPGDFEDWRALGNPGWGWSDVRPCFEAIERNVLGDGRVAGSGPLWVSDVSGQIHPLCRHFFAAARELGLPDTEDFNGPAPEGVGLYRITTKGGRRWSAADAFLRPALRRPNLKLEIGAQAARILFDSRRAIGVEYRKNGQVQRAIARAEVILCAGAVQSPQLLQLSGIGPQAMLRANGIMPLLANEAVGSHLQDHLAVSYYYRSREASLNSVFGSWRGRIGAGLQYLATRRGPLSLSVNQAGGFVRADVGRSRPDLQLYFNPLSYSTKTVGKRRLMHPDPFPGFVLSFQPCRPTSRGRIELDSSDPFAPPRIIPNYLSTERDRADVVAGGRLMQRFAATTAMRSIIEAPIGPDLSAMTEEGILADFRARGDSVFHPVGSCRMGPDAASAVVDANLRVHSVEALRVVDASVFPTLTSGNTNAPVIMLAWKAAAMILADWEA